MGFPEVVILSPDTITAALSAVGGLFLTAVSLFLNWTPLNVRDLCASQPPAMPTLNFDELRQHPELAVRAFRAATWPYFCQCVAGSPAPIPFPPPQIVQPPSWPATPAFPCDPADLCAAIAAIQRDVAALSSTVAQNYALTTLLQRYALPFAYVPGALHFDLVGEGTFTVPRLVGVQANLTGVPEGTKVLDSNPDYLWNMGWMSLSGPAGMLLEKRVTRLEHTWLPAGAQAATRFGYSLKPGVVLAVRELYAEV